MAAVIASGWTRDDADAFVADINTRHRGGLPALAGGAPTIEELEARQAEIRARLGELDAEYAGQIMPEDARAEWNRLGEERAQNDTLLDELNQRQDYLRSIGDDPAHQEAGATFSSAPSRRQGSDIWDVASVRSVARSDEDATRMLVDNARRAAEIAVFPHERADGDRQREHLDRLHARFAGDESGYGDGATFARHILTTGSPLYQRAFGKWLMGRGLTSEEQRALSLGGSSGGYAIPYVLDPTIILTSNGQVNPFRAISRIETIIGNEWRGVSSAGVTASYGDEATEVGDNTPTLAQPTANVEKAQSFIPFSVEVGEDWGSLQSQMAVLFQDAKDALEATKFTTGSGHGSHEPEGLLTGATGTVAAGTASFAVGHLYGLEEALPARWQARAQFVAHRAQYNRVRQLDTNGGANLWVRLGESTRPDANGNTGHSLLGYPANQCSAMASVLTASSKIMTLGDFGQFVIVDRVGMTVELVPHLFGGSGRPTGQRGLYAYWRNTSKVLVPGAFKTLVTT